METRELVNLFAVAQTFEPIQLSHFMAAILPSSVDNYEQLLQHARALLAQLKNSDRFTKPFKRSHAYPMLQDLLRESEKPTVDAAEFRDLLIYGIFEMVWSAMGDEGCTLKEIRERMIVLAVELLVTKHKSMSPRARKDWRFEDRAAWVRQELAKHNPRYAELCSDSVLHREIIRIVTMQLKEEGCYTRARRRRVIKKASVTSKEAS